MRKGMSKKVISLVMIGTILSSNAVYAKELIQKDESVYVTLTEEGNVKEKIVSDWLHADTEVSEIKDKSILKDIKNIKGNEKPEVDGDKLVWKTNKKDIYYQGKADKDVPIEVKVKYELDGNVVTAKDILGKSGKLKVKIDLKNNSYKTLKIKGEDRKVYTPFVTAVLVNLPADKFTNIKTSSGQMVSDGNNQAIAFVALPGLKESFNVNKDMNDLLDLKDNLEITADVNKFEMGPIMVTATPKLPDTKEFKDAKNFDELFDGIDKLKDSSSKLEEGSFKLKDGSKKLKDGLSQAQSKVSEASSMMKSEGDKIALIKSNDNVRKERKLIQDAFFAKKLDTSVLDLATVFSNPQVQKLLEKSAKDYKALNIKSIMQLPSVKKLMAEENLNNMNKLVNDTDKLSKIDMKKLQPALGLLNESDKILGLANEASKLYNGIDLAKIDPLIKLAKNKDMILKVAKDADEVGSYAKSEKLKPLMGLMENKDKLTSLMKDSQDLSKIDLQQMKKFLGAQNQGALSYIGATSFLGSEQNKTSLKNAVMKDTELTSEQKGQLVTLIEAGTQVREGMKQSAGMMSTVGGSIEKLSSMKNNLMVIAPLLNGLPQSIDYVSGTVMPKTNQLFKELDGVKPMLKGVPESMAYVQGVLPQIEKLQGEFQKSKPVIEKAQKTLTPETIAYIKEVTPVLLSMKSDLDANEQNLKAAKVLLGTMKVNGGAKQTMAKIEALESDIQKAKPIVSKIENSLTDAQLAQIKNSPKLVGQLKEMQRDLKDSEKILEVMQDALKQNNIDRARKLLDAVPELSNGVKQLADGSQKLYEGVDSLSSNMKKFNDEGINKLYTTLKDKTVDVEKLIDIKDEIVKLSHEYETFSGTDEKTDGTVKFIMKTDEVKIPEVKENNKKVEVEEESGFVNWIKNIFHKK